MNITPLTPDHHPACADLLAASFDRTPTEMLQLLRYLYAAFPVIACGAWDGDKLAAQYSCLITSLNVPTFTAPVLAGMSVNMAVHPDYRGRGLIKQIAEPVYQAVSAQGGMAGVGFSNAEGVKVDRRSKGYGYQVIGQMQSTIGWIVRRPSTDTLRLSPEWLGFPDPLKPAPNRISFAVSAESLKHRFAHHPFRSFEFGIWEEDGIVRGLVIYHRIRRAGILGAALLAAYSDHLPHLLARWLTAISEAQMRFVHVLTSPSSILLPALRQSIPTIKLPYTRTPYFLTLKPLTPTIPPLMLDFSQWDCIAGDIL